MPTTTPTVDLELPANGAADADREVLAAFTGSGFSQRANAASQSGDVALFSAELRKLLRRRFGDKRSSAERIARRYPQHVANALGALEGLSPGETSQRHPVVGEAATNGHPIGPVPELIRLVALLDGMRRAGSGLSQEMLWPLWKDAWQKTKRLAAAPAETSPLARLLTAEALFASSILFDGATGMRTRRKLARVRLTAELEDHTDTDGTPHASLLSDLPAWFASLTRCADWARRGDVRLWNAEYSGRFDGLLRAVAAMTMPHDHLALCGDVRLRPVLNDALKCSGWGSGSAVGRLIRRLRKQNDLRRVPSAHSALQKIDRSSLPAVQSDWAKLVISRTRWSTDADLFAIAHDSAVPKIELAAFGRRVLSGEWSFLVKIDGEPFTLPGECDAVCWFSDADVDYVELQWTTSPGVVICRQVMLTRVDHQLFVADCVSTPGKPGARVEITSSLPLAAEVTGEPVRPGREIQLASGELPVRCFPIALPMDRIDRGTGALELENNRLLMRQSGAGAAYAPLLFDWNPKRRLLPADWRSLTVTEDGRRLDASAAVGCRIRLGKRQLLVYRNQNGSKSKRAVLGHHHDHETVIGRFTSTGEVDPLVFVE